MSTGSSINSEPAELEPLCEVKLNHHKQRSNWDCGVSCVLMVLSQEKRELFLERFQEILKCEGINKSTWSIDLCYLLNRFNVKFTYYTITLGIHPGYKTHNFYDKILQKDEERVNGRFEDAIKHGIDVKQESVKLSKLLHHLSKCGPVILLTNARYLYCDKCRRKKFTSELMSCLPWGGGYHGHYVVLCGYDFSKEKLFYRDPANTNSVCTINFSLMDKARLCYGTDEDCILIYYDAS